MAEVTSGGEMDSVVSRVDEAGHGALTSMELAHAFVLAEEERGQGVLALVRAAFDYDESLSQEGFFVPMMEGGDFCYPPRVDALTAEQCDLLGNVADAVRSPVARARLNDLCVVRRFGDVGARSRAAVDAYLEMAGANPYSLDENRRLFVSLGRVDWLGRALALASRMRDADRIEQVVAAIVSAAKDSLAEAEAEPGVALGLIGALVDADRAEADDLLSAAQAKYAGDVWNTDEVLVFQLRRLKGDDERRGTLQRERVLGLMEHAETREPLVRMSFLQDAIKLARDYGITDLVQECTRRLESIREEDLDLKEIKVDVPIPPGAIEAGVKEILDAGTWQDALRQLCSTPPSGNVDANRASVEKQMREHPLRSLFPEELLGGDGLPRLRIVTDDDKRSKRLVEHETLSIQLNALVLHPALQGIWEKWGPIPPEELASFLGEQRHVTPDLAAALARAFHRFWNGDAEGALFTAVPRLEALVRALVLAGGLPAYRTQRENKPGQYPGLGALLGMLLAAGFNESWVRYLGTLLSDPMGANQRNDLLHGFIDEPGEALATLVLVGVLFLALRVELRK
jgi:Domain of unknown function (DUF4209)